MMCEKLTLQVKVWALVGPLTCMLAFFVMFIKSYSTPIYLPLILLIGVPVCWKWKLFGVALSASLLGATISYNYLEIALDERLWFLGMSFSIALSLLIVALSFEEVEALVEGMQLESRSRLENLWKVDEKHKRVEDELIEVREEVFRLNVNNHSYQKIVDMCTEQLIEVRANYLKLSNKIHEERVQLSPLPQGEMQKLSFVQQELDKKFAIIEQEKIKIENNV